MALERPTKKVEVEYQLTDIINLLEENKIDEFRTVLEKVSWSGENFGWSRNKNIEHLVNAAILKAIQAGNTEAVKILLDADIYVDRNIHEDPYSEKGLWMPLIWYAVKAGSLDIVKLLVDRKATIKRRYESGDDSAIREAVGSDQTEIAEYLFRHGAEANNVYEGWISGGTTFLAKAALNKSVPMIRLILSHTGAEGILLAISQYHTEASERVRDINRALDDKYYAPERKAHLQIKLEKYISEYKLIVSTLMDFAQGLDFPNTMYIENGFISKKVSPLTLFKLLDSIEGINFNGVSIAGKPITRELLISEKLTGAEKAIVTLNDIYKISDTARQTILTKNIDAYVKSQGGVLDKNNYLNLVPLWSAAKHGDLQTVKARLAAGVSPNEFSAGHYYGKQIPLVEAAGNGHTEICQLLLKQRGLDPTTIPLATDAAKKAGHEQLAYMLHDAQHVDQVDDKGETLLHRAVREGNVEEVTKLISRGADPNHKGKGEYPLTIAASKVYERKWYSSRKPSQEHIAIIKLLLNSGADPNLKEYRTAMEIVGTSGSLEALKLLAPVTKKQDVILPEYCVNAGKHYPWYTEIMYDSYQSNEWLDILSYLRDKYQIDLNQPESGRDEANLLHTVVRNFPNSGEISHAIYDTKRYFGGCGDRDRINKGILERVQRVKHYAYWQFLNQMKRLEWLLDNGVKPVYSNNNRTALIDFVDSSFPNHVPNAYPKVIDKLLAKGTDINFVDQESQDTALLVSAKHGSYTAVKFLLSRGANPNIRDKDGRTALFYAAGTKDDSYPKMVRKLIQHGADVTVKDNSGQTIAEYSNAIRLKWMDNELNYKQWSKKQQNEWQAEFEKTFSYLRNPQIARNIVSTAALTNNLSEKVIQLYKSENPLIDTINTRDLDEDETRILDVFRDMVTGEIMHHPVKVFETVYDLDTLLALPINKRLHPATGQPFTPSDIKPAKEVMEMMRDYSDYLLEKHPEPSNKKQKSAQSKSLFSRLFNGNTKSSDAESNNVKGSNLHP
jgi:ankyrin repeat protein